MLCVCVCSGGGVLAGVACGVIGANSPNCAPQQSFLLIFYNFLVQIFTNKAAKTAARLFLYL